MMDIPPPPGSVPSSMAASQHVYLPPRSDLDQMFACVFCNKQVPDLGKIDLKLSNRWTHVKNDHSDLILFHKQGKRGATPLSLLTDLVKQCFPTTILPQTRPEHMEGACSSSGSNKDGSKKDADGSVNCYALSVTPLDYNAVTPAPTKYTSRCSLCDKYVPSPEREKHIRVVHMELDRYECPICGFKEKWSHKLIGNHILNKHESEINPKELPFEEEVFSNYMITCFAVQDDMPSEEALEVLENASKKRDLWKLGSAQCNMCEEHGVVTIISDNMTSMRGHVQSTHIQEPRFKCPFPECSVPGIWKKLDATTHILTVHQSSINPVAISVDSDKLQQFMQYCFSDHPNFKTKSMKGSKSLGSGVKSYTPPVQKTYDSFGGVCYPNTNLPRTNQQNVQDTRPENVGRIDTGHHTNMGYIAPNMASSVSMVTVASAAPAESASSQAWQNLRMQLKKRSSDSKPIFLKCLLCKAKGVTKMVENNPGSLRSHVKSSHYKEPTFRCPIAPCDWNTKWKRKEAVCHISKVHGSLEEPIEVAVDREKVRKYLDLCFSNDSLLNKDITDSDDLDDSTKDEVSKILDDEKVWDETRRNSPLKRPRQPNFNSKTGFLQCHLCKEKGISKIVNNLKSSLRSHAKSDHYEVPTFRCPVDTCTYTTKWSRKDATYHIEKNHAECTQEPIALSVDKAKLRHCINQCFFPNGRRSAIEGHPNKGRKSSRLNDKRCEREDSAEPAGVEDESSSENGDGPATSLADHLRKREKHKQKLATDIKKLEHWPNPLHAEAVYERTQHVANPANACELLTGIDYIWNNWRVINVEEQQHDKLYIFTTKLLIRLDDSIPLAFSMSSSGQVNGYTLDDDDMQAVEEEDEMQYSILKAALVAAMSKRIMVVTVDKPHKLCGWVIQPISVGDKSYLTCTNRSQCFVFHKGVHGFWLIFKNGSIAPFCMSFDESFDEK